jgi:hypothetical protein
MKQLMTRNEFAVSEAVSNVMIGRWIKLGLPVLADGRIDGKAGRAWLKGNVHRKGEIAARGETFSTARARKETALAGLRELELAKARGEVVAVAEVEATWLTIVTQTRNAILGLPTRIIGHVPVEWRKELQVVLDRECRSLLVGLSAEVAAGGGRGSSGSGKSRKVTVTGKRTGKRTATSSRKKSKQAKKPA